MPGHTKYWPREQTETSRITPDPSRVLWSRTPLQVPRQVRLPVSYVWGVVLLCPRLFLLYLQHPNTGAQVADFADMWVDDQGLQYTVSLYQAKATGRNRVVIVPSAP
jgi:hypothetical protein